MTGVTKMAGGVFTAQFTSAVIQAVSLTLLARFSDPQTFGRAGAVIAAITVLMAVSDLGLGTLAVKAAARDSTHAEIPLVYRTTLGTSLLLAIVVLAGLLTLGQHNNSLYNIAPLAGWLVIEKQFALRSAVAIASQRVASSTRSVIVSRVASLLMLIITLLLPISPILAYSSSYAFGASIGLALLIRRVGSVGPPVRHASNWERCASFRRLVKRSAPFSIATISYQVRTLDVTLVSLISGPMVAGIYALPARLSAPLRLLPTALNSLAMPIVSSGDPEMLKNLRRLTRISWILVAAILATLAVLAESILVLLVGESYRNGATPLRILCLGIAVNVVGSSKSALLQASGDERFIAKMGIGIGIASLAGVALGAYLGGANGAALGMTATYLLQLIVISSRRVLKVEVHA